MRTLIHSAIVLLIGVGIALAAADHDHGHHTQVLPKPDRPADLVKAHVLPDPDQTPGAVYSDVTLEEIRKPGYSATVRDVPESVKHEVFERYGLDWRKIDTHAYEIDHLVELSCTGSNDVHNLWPEPEHLNVGGRDMGAIEKDKVEKKVLAAVRSGELPLKEAQLQLAKDWTVLYRKMVAPEFPKYEEHP
jgi:hypothetical protein